jgi:hypothetical protein
MEVSEVRRGDVYLVMLNPARGDEIRNLRPCLVVSPDELNGALSTFVVAPMTTGRPRVPIQDSLRIPRHVRVYCLGSSAYRGPPQNGSQTRQNTIGDIARDPCCAPHDVRALSRVCDELAQGVEVGCAAALVDIVVYGASDGVEAFRVTSTLKKLLSHGERNNVVTVAVDDHYRRRDVSYLRQSVVSSADERHEGIDEPSWPCCSGHAYC